MELEFIAEIKGKTLRQLQKLIKDKYPEHSDLLKLKNKDELARKLNWRIAGF
jgi:hypothetical protein